jgi:hypothetical protein
MKNEPPEQGTAPECQAGTTRIGILASFNDSNDIARSHGLHEGFHRKSEASGHGLRLDDEIIAITTDAHSGQVLQRAVPLPGAPVT